SQIVTQLNGFDVSSYQSGISSQQVAGDFTIIKATEGDYYTNPYMDHQWHDAQNTGKKLGLYHFATVGNALDQAHFFVNAVRPYLNGQSLLVLDWESDALPQGPSWAKTWLDEVYRETGIRPLIYMSKSVIHDYDWSAIAKNYGLWMAQYADDNETGYQSEPWTDDSDFGAWMTPTIFQYTSHGSLDGYGGPIDLDLFYGNDFDWDMLSRIGQP
ncbi:1,4-beta-N-acetylmuramidase, partial [Oenococcus kitaharae]|uniref:GH25 family lysozyme n=1 Tax=Oenococcus kitaharae TaxID=336988 RepID=UPI0021E8626B